MSRRFKRSGGKPTKPRRAFLRLAGGVNQGFGQISREIDQLKAILGTVIDVLGIDDQVLAKLKASNTPPAQEAPAEQPSSDAAVA